MIKKVLKSIFYVFVMFTWVASWVLLNSFKLFIGEAGLSAWIFYVIYFCELLTAVSALIYFVLLLKKSRKKLVFKDKVVVKKDSFNNPFVEEKFKNPFVLDEPSPVLVDEVKVVKLDPIVEKKVDVPKVVEVPEKTVEQNYEEVYGVNDYDYSPETDAGFWDENADYKEYEEGQR